MKSLSHSGILIPHYNPIGLSITYKKKKLQLSSLAEQMVIIFVKKLDSPYIQDKVFVGNFLVDLSKDLSSNSEGFKDQIRGNINLEDFDFGEVLQYLADVKTKTENMTKEEKKKATELKKQLRDKLKDKYGYAMVDGKRIPLMNWIAEPSAIYLSKGENSLRGRWKRGIEAKEITLNLSEIPKDNEDMVLTFEDILKYLKDQSLLEEDLCLYEILQRNMKLGKDGLPISLRKRSDNIIRKNMPKQKKEILSFLRNIVENIINELEKIQNNGKSISEKDEIIREVIIQSIFKTNSENVWSSLFQEEGDVKNVETQIFEFSKSITPNLLEELHDQGLKEKEISKILKRLNSSKSFALTIIGLLIVQNIIQCWPWGNKVWKPNDMWIASWSSPLDAKMKYVWFSPATSIRQEKEKSKFLFASELGNKMKVLEKYLDNELSSTDAERKKCATAVWLIKNLGIRVGDEKIAGEHGTVGCTTLKAINIKLDKEGLVYLDFIGKDYVRFHRGFHPPKQVYDNLKESTSNIGEDFVFKGLNSNKVSSFLRKSIPGLSARVFRTYIAGTTWDESAHENGNLINLDTPDHFKKYLFKITNLAVAKKLNHKKALPKNYEEKLKIKEARVKEETEKLKNLEHDEKKYSKQKAKVEKLTVELDLLKETSEWNLGTSLTSYISPIKVLDFTKKHNMALKDAYSKSLQEKYSWALQ